MDPAEERVRQWLGRFVAAVRTNDIEAGRRLFSRHVVGYGTKEPRLVGLDALAAGQWGPTWSRVDAWRVDEIDVLQVDGTTATLAFTWTRHNVEGTSLAGRATMILAEEPDGTWLCTHSHFSRAPQLDADGHW